MTKIESTDGGTDNQYKLIEWSISYRNILLSLIINNCSKQVMFTLMHDMKDKNKNWSFKIDMLSK
jgi:phage-related baseplate assembly protein